MDAKRFVIGTLVGGVVVFATGTLLFMMPPFRSFLVFAMDSGPAAGVARQSQLVWAVALAALSYSALITLAIESRGGASNIRTGITVGAVVGFLLWFTADFMLYGVSNVGSLTSTVVGPLLELVPGAMAGGAVAVFLGKTQPDRQNERVKRLATLPDAASPRP
ncbi:MAG TPA: hypothetical protein VFT24_10205 [Vicinamibacterales bacterium]|nr:hypothetical protein [Vicinamibacterales bacterium]